MDILESNLDQSAKHSVLTSLRPSVAIHNCVRVA
jgi:hypothetical protein